MMNVTEFVKRHNIRMTAEYTDSNPYIADDQFARMANHWKCILRINRRRMTVYFSMGRGLAGEPETDDVLSCIASDAAGYENARSFEDWCGDYGYDTDSRTAEKTYKTIGRQSDRLERFIGDADLFQSLLFEVESL